MSDRILGRAISMLGNGAVTELADEDLQRLRSAVEGEHWRRVRLCLPKLSDVVKRVGMLTQGGSGRLKQALVERLPMKSADTADLIGLGPRTLSLVPGFGSYTQLATLQALYESCLDLPDEWKSSPTWENREGWHSILTGEGRKVFGDKVPLKQFGISWPGGIKIERQPDGTWLPCSSSG